MIKLAIVPEYRDGFYGGAQGQGGGMWWWLWFVFGILEIPLMVELLGSGQESTIRVV